MTKVQIVETVQKVERVKIVQGVVRARVEGREKSLRVSVTSYDLLN